MEQGEELERAGSALRSYLRSELDAIDVDPLSAYLPRDPRVPSRLGGIAKWSFALGGTAVILVGALVVGVQLRTLREPAIASATASAAATVNLLPVPLALSSSYGLLAMTRDGFVVRRETDPAPIRRIEPTSQAYERTIAVSRSGRLVAYWRPALPGEPFGDVLMVYDAVTNGDPQRVLSVENEIGGPLVWADDDSGIAFTTFTSSAFRGPSPGPVARLSIVEMQGASPKGQPRLIGQSLEHGMVLVPLAWIRETRTISAVEGDRTGVALAYVIANESGQGTTSRVPVSSGDQVVRTSDVVANQQSRMLAYLVTFRCQDGTPGCTVVRFWALEDPRIAVGWQALPGSTFVGLQWRPFSRDLLVSVRDDRAGLTNGAPAIRLEARNSSTFGSTRSLALMPANSSELIVRPDGRSMFHATLSNGWPAILYDLTSSDSVKTDLTTTSAGDPQYSVTLNGTESDRLDKLAGTSPLLTDTDVLQAVAKSRGAGDRVDRVTATLDRGSYPLGGSAPVWTVKAIGQFVDYASRGLGSVPPARCTIVKFNARSGQLVGIQFLPNESDCS